MVRERSRVQSSLAAPLSRRRTTVSVVGDLRQIGDGHRRLIAIEGSDQAGSVCRAARRDPAAVFRKPAHGHDIFDLHADRALRRKKRQRFVDRFGPRPQRRNISTIRLPGVCPRVRKPDSRLAHIRSPRRQGQYRGAGLSRTRSSTRLRKPGRSHAGGFTVYAPLLDRPRMRSGTRRISLAIGPREFRLP